MPAQTQHVCRKACGSGVRGLMQTADPHLLCVQQPPACKQLEMLSMALTCCSCCCAQQGVATTKTDVCFSPAPNLLLVVIQLKTQPHTTTCLWCHELLEGLILWSQRQTECCQGLVGDPWGRVIDAVAAERISCLGFVARCCLEPYNGDLEPHP